MTSTNYTHLFPENSQLTKTVLMNCHAVKVTDLMTDDPWKHNIALYRKQYINFHSSFDCRF